MAQYNGGFRTEGGAREKAPSANTPLYLYLFSPDCHLTVLVWQSHLPACVPPSASEQADNRCRRADNLSCETRVYLWTPHGEFYGQAHKHELRFLYI